MAGRIDLLETRSNQVDRHNRRGGLRAKLDLALERSFSEGNRIIINPTLDLDEGKFGGGNLQLVFGF